MNRRLRTIAVCSYAIAAIAEAGGSSSWLATWMSCPRGNLDASAILRTKAAFPTWSAPEPIRLAGTVRYRVRLAVGGERVRLVLANPFSTLLNVAAVSIAVAGSGTDAMPGTIRAVSFGGERAVSIPVDASVWSDPVVIDAADGMYLLVSMYLHDGIALWSDSGAAPFDSELTDAGDHTLSPRLPSPSRKAHRPLLTRVDVSSRGQSRVVVALGDSITDGDTNPRGERGWPGLLASRLAPARISVVNAGIAGNRLLQPGGAEQDAALARLDRDVFSVPGVTHVVVLEGINDIGLGGAAFPLFSAEIQPLVRAADVVAAYRQIIARGRAQGVKVIAATLLPFEGAIYFSTAREEIRQQVNRWIRTAGEFDAVVDFDARMRDPQRPSRLRAEFDSGDGLHPSAAGYEAMANSIPRELFE